MENNKKVTDNNNKSSKKSKDKEIKTIIINPLGYKKDPKEIEDRIFDILLNID